MIRPLLALALLATPALADSQYTCEHGSSMTYVDATGEMLVKRPGEMTVSIPHAGAAGRFSWWSPYEDSFECEKAPCAEQWVPAHAPMETWFILDEGHRVDCLEK